MNKVNAKVYYDNATGDVILITSECMGEVIATTKAEDMGIYSELKDKQVNEIDFIELEFGTLASTFNNVKSYTVNVNTKQLELVHYTDSELQEIKDQEIAVISLDNRIADISTYLKDQSNDTIAEFENYILQTELNKITEGVN